MCGGLGLPHCSTFHGCRVQHGSMQQSMKLTVRFPGLHKLT